MHDMQHIQHNQLNEDDSATEDEKYQQRLSLTYFDFEQNEVLRACVPF